MTTAGDVGSGQPRPDVEGRSVGELVGELTGDLSKLMRQELELARTEITAEAVKAGRAGGMLGGAGVLAHLTLVFFALALMWALGNVMDLGWAALVVGAVLAIGATVLFVVGRRQLSEIKPKPELTVETVKEDVRWARTQNS